jgi:hypothetical protein
MACLRLSSLHKENIKDQPPCGVIVKLGTHESLPF